MPREPLIKFVLEWLRNACLLGKARSHKLRKTRVETGLAPSQTAEEVRHEQVWEGHRFKACHERSRRVPLEPAKYAALAAEEGTMNRAERKIAAWTVASCLTLAVAISPALARPQASSSSTPTASPATPASGSATSKAGANKSTKATGAGFASSEEIAAAKASGKVWVNTDSGVYHKSGRWYGKTKAGKFMTESEAKAAGYKEAQKKQ